jgi:hypothetical protein
MSGQQSAAVAPDHPDREGSGRETGTTLGTTGIDDLAAATGSHAGTEAVSAGALQITGLKSTFHGRNPDTLGILKS